MRIVLPALVVFSLLFAFVPHGADARLPLPCEDPSFRSCLPERNCLQVYPWSKLCEGDIQGFLEAFCDGPCFA